MASSSASSSLEGSPISALQTEGIPNAASLDIEHIPVCDDPRKWSPLRKNIVLLLISMGSMIAGFSANIQNPAIKQMEEDLPATSSQISLTLSLFILIQGSAPLFWATLSEIKGRKTVYLVSLTIFLAGSIAVALSQNVGTVIGFRIFQAAGSSAVMALGAGTLADVFDSHERGTKMGIYYLAPLLGPALAPIFGGVLTNAFNWRAVFWFLVILSGTTFLSFWVFFRDTFRKERSLTFQNVLKRQLREHAHKLAKKEKDSTRLPEQPIHDVEKQGELPLLDVKMTFRDLSPIKPMAQILRRINNIVILTASGIIFGFAYCVVYTGSRTLGNAYNYSALKIGCVLLSFGAGQMIGSLIGGRYSDIVLARFKEKHGRLTPEMRLQSGIHGLILFPASILAFGWCSDKRVHVGALCVTLFFCGFFSTWVYTGTLAYIVDANVGRSSVTVALNSFFRGLAAFIGTEVVVPIQDNLGDGWLYTIFAGLICLSGALIFFVLKKGEKWRLAAEAREGEEAAAEVQDSAVVTAVPSPRAGTPVSKETS